VRLVKDLPSPLIETEGIRIRPDCLAGDIELTTWLHLNSLQFEGNGFTPTHVTSSKGNKILIEEDLQGQLLTHFQQILLQVRLQGAVGNRQFRMLGGIAEDPKSMELQLLNTPSDGKSREWADFMDVKAVYSHCDCRPNTESSTKPKASDRRTEAPLVANQVIRVLKAFERYTKIIQVKSRAS
jgi:hypothetical protein